MASAADSQVKRLKRVSVAVASQGLHRCRAMLMLFAVTALFLTRRVQEFKKCQKAALKEDYFTYTIACDSSGKEDITKWTLHFQGPVRHVTCLVHIRTSQPPPFAFANQPAFPAPHTHQPHCRRTTLTIPQERRPSLASHDQARTCCGWFAFLACLRRASDQEKGCALCVCSYRKGMFTVSLEFPPQYPSTPPRVCLACLVFKRFTRLSTTLTDATRERLSCLGSLCGVLAHTNKQIQFATKVFHPNIRIEDGKVCNNFWDGVWNLQSNALLVVEVLRGLLANPNYSAYPPTQARSNCTAPPANLHARARTCGNDTVTEDHVETEPAKLLQSDIVEYEKKVME